MSTLRERVTTRAGNCCEYCQLSQEDEPFSIFHIEHIIARKHSGSHSENNLCLACSSCNLYKGSDIAGIDSKSGGIVPLFHPRSQRRDEHFRWDETNLVGISPTGKATVEVLRINSAERNALAEERL